MTVALQIEGPGAGRAADDLARIPGLSVTVEMASDQDKKAKDFVAVATAVATIVGAAGGVKTIADQILSWRDRWRKRRERSGGDHQDGAPEVEKMILIVDGRRLLLDNVSLETMARLLRRIANPRE